MMGDTNLSSKIYNGGDNMMLIIMKAIENIVDEYADDYRFINDHEFNVVCQIDTDEERMEIILAEIDEVLPAGIIFSHVYMADEYEITFKKIGDDIMNQNPYTVKATFIDASIQNEFGPLDWIDQTLHEDGMYSISFTGPRVNYEEGELCRSAGFLGRQDAFFSKMHKIKNMIKNCGYNAELIKFDADKDCPYSEATINMNLAGGEL